MLDAPVSGGEIGAKNATLTIMVGGDEKTFERARPMLACMGKPESVTYIGESGAGQIAKLCNQICIGGALAGVAEAYRAGEERRHRSRRACARRCSAASRRSKVLEFHGQRMITGDYKPGFFTRLYQKDLRLVNETAMANNVRHAGDVHRHAVRERARDGRRRRAGLRGGGRSVVCAVGGKAGEDRRST